MEYLSFGLDYWFHRLIRGLSSGDRDYIWKPSQILSKSKNQYSILWFPYLHGPLRTIFKFYTCSNRQNLTSFIKSNENNFFSQKKGLISVIKVLIFLFYIFLYDLFFPNISPLTKFFDISRKSKVLLSKEENLFVSSIIITN